MPATRHDLGEELRLSCAKTFGLHTASIECTPKTTVDEFNEAGLVDVADFYEDASEVRNSTSNPTFSVEFSSTRDMTKGRFGSIGNNLDDQRIADVIIATNLDQADSSVQVQALELLRMKRIFTRTSMHTAPRDFLFVVVSSEPAMMLTHLLNDIFAISHFHAEDDVMSYVDGTKDKDTAPLLPSEDIKTLQRRAKEIHLTVEVSAYLHNVIIFL